MNVQALVNISIEPKEMRSWEGGFAQITVGQSRFQSPAQPQISGLFITQAQNGADRRVPEYFVVVCSDGVGGRCLGGKLPNRRPIFENIRVSPEKSR
jgi:hypothetical protein